MKKTDKERIKKILSIWSELKKQIAQHNITPEQIMGDEFSRWAITTPLYNIGEQVYQLSAEFKQTHPELPCSFVSGLRHRLVHDYDGINWSIITKVIYNDMDEFISELTAIYDTME